MPEAKRDEFELPEGEHYLNAAYMTPILRTVEEAGVRGIRLKRFPSTLGPSDFFEEADRVRALFARLIGAPEPERVAIQPAVSYGIAAAARNVAIERGQNVVVLEGQFPSNALIWRRLARETGAELRTVAAPPAGPGRSAAWNERLLESIDAGTAVVALPPVHWTDGTRIDLVAAGAAARSAGAALVVDGTQAVGGMPFDVAEVRPDALVCATYKWLLGPYGMALSWYGPRFDGGTPLEETWLGRAGSEDFRGLVDYVDEYRPAAARYDMGGRSNFVLLPMVAAGLEKVLEWTPAGITAYCRDLTAPLFDGIGELGITVDRPDGRAGHLFGLRTPDGVDMESLRAELERRRIHVSLRGSAVRVSPHMYNEEGDIGALLEALRESTSAISTNSRVKA